MRSTITRSLAAVTLGAALTIAPVGVAFADGHMPEADVALPFDPELNQADAWEEWLLDEFDIVATCTKLPGEPDDPFVVPPQPSEDEEWSLLVIKGGASDSAHEAWFYPEPGWELSHSTAGNSHVIVCTSDVEDEHTPTKTKTPTPTMTHTPTETKTHTPTVTKTVTGPVVETDRPAGGDSSQLGLFAGAGVLLAAAGAIALNRRRQSAEH